MQQHMLQAPMNSLAEQSFPWLFLLKDFDSAVGDQWECMNSSTEEKDGEACDWEIHTTWI